MNRRVSLNIPATAASRKKSGQSEDCQQLFAIRHNPAAARRGRHRYMVSVGL